MFNTSKIGYLCLARMTLFNNASVENGLLSIYTEQLKLEAFQTKSDEPPTFSDQCKWHVCMYWLNSAELPSWVHVVCLLVYKP